MGANFHNIPMVHTQDHIRIADGGKAVGDDKGCSALHEVFHTSLDEDFSSCINGRSCFIKNQNLWIREVGSCDRQQLLLSLGDVGTFFIDHGVITMVKGSDEVVNTGSFCRIDDFFIRGVHPAIADVFHHRIAG